MKPIGTATVKIDPHPPMLLWMDLETTGLDPARDEIIEVAWQITKASDLTTVSGPQTWTLPCRPYAFGRLCANNDVRAMHEHSGLLAEVVDLTGGKPGIDGDPFWVHLREVEGEIIEDVDRFAPAVIHLAGSGVAEFDRRFIARWMPKLDNRLHYRSIGIGPLRRYYEWWSGKPLPSNANEAKTHRAADDLACHITEARAFRSLWREERNDDQ